VFAINYVAYQNVAISMQNFRVPIALLFINNYLMSNYCRCQKNEVCACMCARAHICSKSWNSWKSLKALICTKTILCYIQYTSTKRWKKNQKFTYL